MKRTWNGWKEDRKVLKLSSVRKTRKITKLIVSRLK